MAALKKVPQHGIPTLDKTNHDIWLDSLTTCFQAMDLKKLVKKSVGADDKHSDADEGTGLMLIKSTLDDVGKRYIMGVATVHDALTKLRSLYGKDINMYQLETDFGKLSWTSDMSADIFVNNLTDLRLKMKELDSNVSDDRFIRKLIECAPKSMANVVTHYETELMLNKNVSLSELETVIIKTARKLALNKKEEASVSYYTNVPRSGFRYKKKRPYCKSCRQNGHWTNECTNNRSHIIEQRLSGESQRGNSSNDRNQSNRGTAPNNNRGNQQVPHGANVPNNDSLRRSDRPPSAYCVASGDQLSCPRMLLDNCSNDHITGDPAILRNYRAYNRPKPMQSINGGQAIGVGDVEVCGNVQGVYCEITLKDVLFIPTAGVTIISQLKFENKGCIPKFSSDNRHNYIGLYDDYGCVLSARRLKGSSDFYETTYQPRPTHCMFTRSEIHDLLGHPCDNRADHTPEVTIGLKVDKEESRDPVSSNCETCVEAKMKRRSFNHKLGKETKPGFVLHADVNHMPVESIGRKKYALIFKCEASKYTRVYYTTGLTADEIADRIADCFTDQFHDLGYVPIRLHTDNASYFESETVQAYLRSNKCKWTSSSPYNAPQNGIAEKGEQDITAITRALRIGASLPKKVWTLTMSHATFLFNRTYNETIKMTPFEYYRGFMPDLSKLRMFGTPFWVHDLGDKLDGRSVKMIYVGQAGETQVNYVALSCEHNSVKTVSSVTFLSQPRKQTNIAGTAEPETAAAGNCTTNQIDLSIFEKSDAEPQSESTEEDEQVDDLDSAADEFENLSVYDEPMNSTIIARNDNQSAPAAQIESNESFLNATVIQQVKPQVFDFKIKVSEVVIPKSIKEVYGNPHEEQWLEAMDEEHLCWLENEAFELVAPTGRETVLGGHYRYTLKAEGEYVSRFKARYVIDGSEIDTKPDHSPVAGIEAVRLILAWAARNGMHAHSVDITTAFLNTEMVEETFAKQMPLYEIPNKPHLIYRLRRWSYGLPGSSYHWYAKLTKELIDMGFTQSTIEPCVFYSKGFEVIVFCYVDDLGLVSAHLDRIVEIKKKLGEKFKYRDAGPITKMLGIDFVYQREEHRLMMSLKNQIINLYKRNEKDVPSATKVPLDCKTQFDIQSPPARNVFRYRSNVGSMNFIATRVRPEITYYVNQLAKQMKAPTEHHEKLALRVIAYLYATVNYVLTYEGKPDGDLLVWSDSNFKPTAPRCNTGTLIQFGTMPILWSSKTQSAVAADNCFAELFAINASLNKGLYVRNLMIEIGVRKPGDLQIRIRVDNKAAKTIAETVLGPNSKHYHPNMAYVQDFVKRGEIVIEYCRSLDNIADLYTKLVANGSFYNLRELVCVVNNHKRRSTRLAPSTSD